MNWNSYLSMPALPLQTAPGPDEPNADVPRPACGVSEFQT